MGMVTYGQTKTKEPLVNKLAALLTIALIVLPAIVQAKPLKNVDKKGLALDGYDAVAYTRGKAVKGSKAHTHTREEITYHFASADNLATFKAAPERYLPAYGGWCAYAMLGGDKVDVNPKTFKVINGKTYLFYDAILGNTLKKWNNLASKDPEADLVKKANGKWADLAKK